MILVDSNILLDLLTEDPEWFKWSTDRLVEHADVPLAINPLIYAEISPGFADEAALEARLSGWKFHRLPLPYDAAFLAGKAFLAYRQRGGTKRSPLPDFYIGAHAMTAGLPLLTRDPARYRTYFHDIKLIAPTGEQA